MNYGRKQTKRKIKAVNSKSQKYFNKVGISFFKACFVFILFAIVTGVGAGIGAYRGILERAPELNPESVAPSAYITTLNYRKGKPV